ncbi:MAG: DNA-processing protein DprA [Rickettsiales bacterium]|nr:DNA-processing protein DprA [Rickettsiales bacterium]
MNLTASYASLSAEKLPDVLQLIRTLNVGPVTFFALLKRFGTAAKALDALPDLSLRGGRAKPLIPYDRDAALREIEQTKKIGARMIMYGEPDYPQLLQAIHDPPPIITVWGHAHIWKSRDSVAIVGARNASANGCQFAQRISKELSEQKFLVTSGLARGIDSFAHKGALPHGTVAVIAGGIDNIYPPENEALYAQIREQGAIISEQPFGMAPFAGSFPGRNRIIAGMSLGTVVVEAAPKSGSLITAKLALDYHRDVFAVPGSPMDPRAKGCNQLLRDGAQLTESAGDIIRGLAHWRNFSMTESTMPSYITTPLEQPNDSELGTARDLILEKLSINPVGVDELIEQCHISAPAALTVLLELELAGKLKRSAGNNVSLVARLDEKVA